ncbi:MAG: MBL fold metallo-hydrolase [Anaerolineae bacterium]
MVEIVKLTVGPIAANCYLYLAEQTGQAIIIDPGAEPQRLLDEINLRDLQVTAIILSHFHFDHVMAAEAIRAATHAPVAVHSLDAPYLANQPALFQMFLQEPLPGLQADRLLKDGDIVSIGADVLQVLHTPGHSPGGICLYNKDAGVLFSGDTLFRHGIGRTDFPGCDNELLISSIRMRLFSLPADTVVFPGHGPKTTIKEERGANPYLA